MEIQDKLKQGIIKPNQGYSYTKEDDGNQVKMCEHVVKFICGAGSHSENKNNGQKGVLKYQLLEHAKDEMGLSAYMNEQKGNVLVRL